LGQPQRAACLPQAITEQNISHLNHLHALI
jgi:hypothetical protein